MPLDPKELQECASHLKRSVLLRSVPEKDLHVLCKSAEKKRYHKGDILQKEGESQNRMVVLAEGSAMREKLGENGEIHHIDTYMGGTTVGSLHVMNKDPAYATTRCTSDVTTYEIPTEPLVKYFRTNPDFATAVAMSLTMEIRRHTRNMRTPLLEQHPKKTPWFAVSVAASIESFYRAALNAILNQHLTGVKRGSLFPNMHIQVPTRIVYINGFKGIRAYLDEKISSKQFLPHENPTYVRLLAAVTPGVLMTPVSSILEASNAGHSNPEPIYTRWMRGILPRTLREVIFGVGLNQLSDYCEERVPTFIENHALRNALGSLSAGVMSGYLSHVVHNLSTLKLMNPNKSYGQHLQEYIKKAESRVPIGLPPSIKGPVTVATALLFPAGYLIRTTQIVGSFIILNGTIGAINRYLSKPATPK